MANPEVGNPILEAVIDNLAGRLDVDVIQHLVGQVRAQAAANAAAYFEAEAQLAEARRLILEAVEDFFARVPPSEEEEGEEDEEEEDDEVAVAVRLMELDDPELVARAAALLEVIARTDDLFQQHQLLHQALVFLVILRAIAFVVTRAPLLPRVLLAVAAAYAIAYVASWGRVVPGLASLLRIAVLVLCFLLGRGPRLMLGA